MIQTYHRIRTPWRPSSEEIKWPLRGAGHPNSWNNEAPRNNTPQCPPKPFRCSIKGRCVLGTGTIFLDTMSRCPTMKWMQQAHAIVTLAPKSSVNPTLTRQPAGLAFGSPHGLMTRSQAECATVAGNSPVLTACVKAGGGGMASIVCSSGAGGSPVTSLRSSQGKIISLFYNKGSVGIPP